MLEKSYFKTRLTKDKKRDEVWHILGKYFQQFIPKNATVLDMGAGYATFINNIKAKHRIALDTFEDLPKHVAKGVSAHVESCTHMKSIKSGSVDVVFASNLLEHLHDDECAKTLKEVMRVLKKRGKFIILQPNFKYAYKEYFDDYTHVKMYTEVSLVDVLRGKGFGISKVVARFLPYSMKSKMSVFSFLTGIYVRMPIRPFAKQMLIVAHKP